MASAIAVAERPIDLRTGRRCIAAITVGNLLHRRVDERIRGTGIQRKLERAAAVGIGTDRGSTHDHVAARETERAAAGEHILGIGPAVPRQR